MLNSRTHLLLLFVILRLSTIMLTILICLKASHFPLLLHDQNKKWLVAKLRIMECLEGEEQKAELTTASARILTSCLPGSSQKTVVATFLRRSSWFTHLVSSFLSPLLFCEWCRNMRKIVTQAKVGLASPQTSIIIKHKHKLKSTRPKSKIILWSSMFQEIIRPVCIYNKMPQFVTFLYSCWWEYSTIQCSRRTTLQ